VKRIDVSGPAERFELMVDGRRFFLYYMTINEPGPVGDNASYRYWQVFPENNSLSAEPDATDYEYLIDWECEELDSSFGPGGWRFQTVSALNDALAECQTDAILEECLCEIIRRSEVERKKECDR